MENENQVKRPSWWKYKWITFRRKSLSEKITYCLFFVFFLTMAVAFVYPFFSIFINTFRPQEEYQPLAPGYNPFDMPKDWQFYGWKEIFTEFVVAEQNYFIMLWNSLWMLVVRVTVNILSSTFLAYAVARFRFPGKEFLYGLVIFSQTFPIFGAGAAGFKLFTSLNMVDNPMLFWIAWCGGFDFAFIVLYGTFKGISSTYSEAATIDGANNLVILFKIIFPQAFPSILALAITQAITVWNDFNTPLIYLPSYPNIAYGLFEFSREVQSGGIDATDYQQVYNVAIVLSAVPIIVLYSASQKLILTNMTAGGLKG